MHRWFWRPEIALRGFFIPTFIPEANKFAERFAKIVGGNAMSMLAEILFDIPGTAHCLGGCPRFNIVPC
jgi:cholesterol oxidase